MTPLPSTFRGDGFNFTQLWRSGRVAMFSKSKPGWESACYEVVIVQQVKEKTFPNGHTTPAHEAMPSSESWGVYGWSPANRESAERKFREISDNPKWAT